jgi:hypothetical protein
LGGMQQWFEKNRTRILDDFGEKPAEW